MFQTLRLEVMDRFTAVEHHFRESRRLRGLASQSSKGLAFIQVYAIHEFTVREVVRIAADQISAHAHSYADLRYSLLTIFLDPQLRSVRDCGPDRIWEKRLALFEQAVSNDSISIMRGELPVNGTHFRHSHLELILRVFGISRRLTVRRRHLYKIDEVVDNRNFIAHGEKTPEEVGKRYSRQDIAATIRQIKSICLRLILIMAEQCGDPNRHLR